MPCAQQPVVDGHVHQVPDRVVARADQVADDPALAQRGQADARRLRQLEHEHRQRPRRRERAPLDRDHLRQVRVGQAPDLECGRCRSWLSVGLASGLLGGSRGGRPRAARPPTAGASRQTYSARTTWAGESSGATRMPAASRTSRNRTEPSPAASGVSPASARARRPAPARPRRAPSARSPRSYSAANTSPAPGVDQRQPQAAALRCRTRQRRERRHRPQLQAVRVRQRRAPWRSRSAAR